MQYISKKLFEEKVATAISDEQRQEIPEGARFCVFRETRVSGYIDDDGSDSRVWSTKIVVIPEDDEDGYQEYLADCEYSQQDYSYQFDTEKVAVLTWQELQQLGVLLPKIDKRLTQSVTSSQKKQEVGR